MAELEQADIRAIVDDRNEKNRTQNSRQRAQTHPISARRWRKEQANGEISVRKQGEGDQGSMKIATFVEQITREVNESINQ